MDSVDKALLNEIQSDFPVATHPYRELGERLGISEDETLRRVASLREEGIIRRLGASINSRRIGFVSTLCAAKAPEEKFDLLVSEINACKGVTHNYLRDHEFNIWFTLISPSEEEKQATIKGLTHRTGIEILELPARRIFKIRVDFKF
jgi:DNA-binding Lrp family transcriptional regulator